MSMTLNRGVLFVGGGALLAAWLAAAADGGRRTPPAPDAHAVSALDRAESLARDIQAQASRLRARLADAPEPARSGRNPFAFHNPRPATPGARPSIVSAESPAVDIIEPVPLTLSGIAEESGTEAGTLVRVAVLSGLGDVFLARAGDTIASRYEVVAVGADAAELRDLTTGRTIRLGLR